MDILGAIKDFFTLPEAEQPTTEPAPEANVALDEPVTLEEVGITLPAEPLPLTQAPPEGFDVSVLPPPQPEPPTNEADTFSLDPAEVETMDEDELLRRSRIHPFYAYHLGQRWAREGKI